MKFTWRGHRLPGHGPPFRTFTHHKRMCSLRTRIRLCSKGAHRTLLYLRTHIRALVLHCILFIACILIFVTSLRIQASHVQLTPRALAAIEVSRRYDADADQIGAQLCTLYNCSTTLRQQPQSNPLSPTLIQYVETKYNGFGAQFLRMVDALALATVLSARFEVGTRKYWNYGCAAWRGWACYFDGHSNSMRSDCIELEDWAVTTAVPPCLRVTTDKSAARAAAILRQIDRPLDISRLLARQLWVLNKRTSFDVAQLDQTAQLPYIGLHIRRGDKKSEVTPVHAIKYVYAVDCIDPYRKLDIYIATDDGSVLPSLRALLAPRRVITQPDAPARHGHSQLRSNQNYLKRNRHVVTALIGDIEALRHATYFIGTFSSNLSRLVHLLRRNASFSLDNRWAPGVAWRTFETTSCSTSCSCFV